MTEDRGEGFLGRWSRLKRARRDGDDVRDPAEPELPEPQTREPEIPGPDAAAAEAPVEGGAGEGGETPDLPPIESLDKDSDFSLFMKEGVPEEIRRQALRKLWLTDPVFANLDGLVEYGEDFSAPWRNTTVVKTLYRVGKGMPGVMEEIAEEVAGESDAGETGAEQSAEVRTAEASASDSVAETTGSDEADTADSEARPSEPAQGQSNAPRSGRPARTSD